MPFNFSYEDALKYIKGLKNFLYNPRRAGYLKNNKDRFENKPDPLSLMEIRLIEEEIKEWENYIKIIKLTNKNEQANIYSKVANLNY